MKIYHSLNFQNLWTAIYREHILVAASIINCPLSLSVGEMIQRGFQNVSVDTWKLNKHCLLVYSVFECSHSQFLILTFTFSNKSATLHESVKVFISMKVKDFLIIFCIFLGTPVYNSVIIRNKIKLVWFYLRIIAELEDFELSDL